MLKASVSSLSLVLLFVSCLVVIIQTDASADKKLPAVSVVPKEQRKLLNVLVDNGGTPAAIYLPLGLCEGDCDSNNDCSDGLTCFQRDAGDPVPGCVGGESVGVGTDFCIKISSGVESAEQARQSTTSRASGLGKCEGDCDYDSDCRGNMICYQRSRGDRAPPQCPDINTRRQIDYCVDPDDPAPAAPTGFFQFAPVMAPVAAPAAPSSKPLRLKLYWEEGYAWQDESFERKWCAMSDFDGYPGRGKCWYGLDILPCNPEHVYITKCNDDQRQKWVMEYVNDDEALIRVNGQDRCMHRSDVHIVLRPCDSGNKLQRFFAIRGGFDEYRFEISQKSATRYCLNQAHHPKPGEVLAMYPCATARSPEHSTSYWEFY